MKKISTVRRGAWEESRGASSGARSLTCTHARTSSLSHPHSPVTHSLALRLLHSEQHPHTHTHTDVRIHTRSAQHAEASVAVVPVGR